MSRFLEAGLAGFALLLSVATAANAADVAQGEKVFGRCKVCHAVGEGARNKAGPHLNDVFGRTAGTVDGFRYSPAMTKAGEEGLTWNDETLKAYLADPRGFIKGNRMAFPGLKKEDDLENVAAYLATFSSKAPGQAGQAETVPEAAPKAPAREPSMQAGSPEGIGAGAHFRLGRAATDDEIDAWDIDIRPDGAGLPPGHGTVTEGQGLYDEMCASCHGDFGEAIGRWPALAGGHGTLRDDRPVKTIGSYWPYLSTVYDYVRRAMPFGAARSLSDDDVYALTAYLLYLNDIVTDEDFELRQDNFASVRLPNEENFVPDDRDAEPHHAATEPCMSDCKPGKAEIRMHAAVLDVTPEETGEGKGGSGIE